MIELMTPLEIMERFVENIEKERIRRKMTQADLYKAIGISASGYGKFIKNKNTSFENIIKILLALNMSSNLEALITIQEFTTLQEIRDKNKNKVKKRFKRIKNERN